MKIEIIKEEKLMTNGIEASYWVELGGEYISGSITHDPEEAEKFYQIIKTSNRKPESKQTIKSEEI